MTSVHGKWTRAGVVQLKLDWVKHHAVQLLVDAADRQMS